MLIKIKCDSLKQTKFLGSILASLLKENDVLLLNGPMGMGKTTLVKFILEELGVKENVISPTFNILKEYRNNHLRLVHIDAYRLEGRNDELGFLEQMDHAITFIEWPIYFDTHLIDENRIIYINIEKISDDGRLFIFEALNEYFIEQLKKYADSLL